MVRLSLRSLCKAFIPVEFGCTSRMNQRVGRGVERPYGFFVTLAEGLGKLELAESVSAKGLLYPAALFGGVQSQVWCYGKQFGNCGLSSE